MNFGFVATRLAGTDGVSLETWKLAAILSRLGHTCFYCAGEMSSAGPAGTIVPEMSFNHPVVRRLQTVAFSSRRADGLASEIRAMAKRIQDRIREFVRAHSVDVLVPQNALTIPMNLPLGVALTDFIAETGIRTVAHHHDFWWERERFSMQAVPEILSRCFPPALPSIRHVVINSLAQRALALRLNLASVVLPNVLDFEAGPSAGQGRGAELRRAIGIDPEDMFILQPTRVVPRKGIEHSIELARRIQEGETNRRHVLVLTHHAGDEGDGYLRHLKSIAACAGVELLYVASLFIDEGGTEGGGSARVWTLQDAYEASDFVSYPSLVEGFGNAFLEAVFYRRPLLVNRYPVYVSDIAPCGFRVVEIDRAITDDAVRQVRALLANPAAVRKVTDHNYASATEHFSYRTAERVMKGVLSSLA